MTFSHRWLRRYVETRCLGPPSGPWKMSVFSGALCEDGFLFSHSSSWKSCHLHGIINQPAVQSTCRACPQLQSYLNKTVFIDCQMTCECSPLIFSNISGTWCLWKKSESTEVIISVKKPGILSTKSDMEASGHTCERQNFWYGSLCIRTDNLSGFEAEDHPRNLGSPAGPGVITKTWEKQTLPLISGEKLIFLERTWAENERSWDEMGQWDEAHCQYTDAWSFSIGATNREQDTQCPCNLGTEKAEE